MLFRSLVSIIDAKVAGTEPVAPAPVKASPAQDIMAVLAASVEAAKKGRSH